ncbi:MAG: glycosyltransferase family 2 protein [Sulfitobacter sp.]
MTGVSVLIPAHNEAAYLPACLEALLAADPVAAPVEVIVAANGCTDDTVQIAERYEEQVLLKGWSLKVVSIPNGGKLNALNKAEAAASGDVLIYVDADVEVSPPLIAQLAETLAEPLPRYASGHPNVTAQDSVLTRHYTRFWQTIPFIKDGVPGFGVFAMNRAGRARWGAWPHIISDDTFARLNFRPDERFSVPATYDWPMVEGFAALVRVRRRQNVGVAEIEALYPQLLGNADPPSQAAPLWQRILHDPLGFAAFASVRLAVKLPILRNTSTWARGR